MSALAHQTFPVEMEKNIGHQGNFTNGKAAQELLKIHYSTYQDWVDIY